MSALLYGERHALQGVVVPPGCGEGAGVGQVRRGFPLCTQELDFDFLPTNGCCCQIDFEGCSLIFPKIAPQITTFC